MPAPKILIARHRIICSMVEANPQKTRDGEAEAKSQTATVPNARQEADSGSRSPRQSDTKSAPTTLRSNSRQPGLDVGKRAETI
jgi:hypothetical protein